MYGITILRYCCRLGPNRVASSEVVSFVVVVAAAAVRVVRPPKREPNDPVYGPARPAAAAYTQAYGRQYYCVYDSEPNGRGHDCFGLERRRRVIIVSYAKTPDGFSKTNTRLRKKPTGERKRTVRPFRSSVRKEKTKVRRRIVMLV